MMTTTYNVGGSHRPAGMIRLCVGSSSSSWAIATTAASFSKEREEEEKRPVREETRNNVQM